jgi:hypothetical protein
MKRHTRCFAKDLLHAAGAMVAADNSGCALSMPPIHKYSPKHTLPELRLPFLE